MGATCSRSPSLARPKPGCSPQSSSADAPKPVGHAQQTPARVYSPVLRLGCSPRRNGGVYRDASHLPQLLWLG